MPCLTYAPTLAAIEQTEVQSKRKENKAKLWIHGRKIKASVIWMHKKAIHLQA
jgi:hypothetical protein